MDKEGFLGIYDEMINVYAGKEESVDNYKHAELVSGEDANWLIQEFRTRIKSAILHADKHPDESEKLLEATLEEIAENMENEIESSYSIGEAGYDISKLTDEEILDCVGGEYYPTVKTIIEKELIEKLSQGVLLKNLRDKHRKSLEVVLTAIAEDKIDNSMLDNFYGVLCDDVSEIDGSEF